MPFLFWVLIFCSLVFATLSQRSEAAEYRANEDKFSINVPSGWQSVSGLYGAPFMFLGPEGKTERRSVVVVTPAGFSTEKFDLASQEKEQHSYQKGRRAWLENNGGEDAQFLPIANENWGKSLTALATGFSYRFESERFQEKTYYVRCGSGRLFHIKHLHPFSSGSTEILGNASVRSFTCKD